MTSWLVAEAACVVVVAVSARQAVPAADEGKVPCTSKLAVSPACKLNVDALPSVITGSDASATPLLLVSRSTRIALMSSVSAAQPAPLFTKVKV